MKKVYTIGRDPQSDIVINDSTDVVSRLHATIRIDGSKTFLIDQSQNGTYVNGMRMSANEEIPVTRKDTISFANIAELDWSLLPDPKKDQMKTVAIVIASLAIVAAIVFGILHYLDNNDNSNNEETTSTTNTETISTPPIEDNAAETETTPAEADPVQQVEPTPSSPTAKGKSSGKNKDKKEGQPEEEKNETPKTENEIPLY